jgi:hypothetical protein
MAEQSAAASQSLSQETEQLSALIGQFNVSDGADAAIEARSRRARAAA